MKDAKYSGKYLEVLSSNVAAINTVADTVRATVGPKGLDVMLIDQYGEYACTNDGVTILSSIEVNHPVAKLVVEVAKAQEHKAGDGTTTATLLAANILNNALSKVKDGATPNRIVKGIELAKNKVIEEFKNQAQTIKNVNDPKLKSITKIAARGDEKVADLLIEAASRITEKNQGNLDFGFSFVDCVYAATGHESKIINGLFIKKKSHFKYNQTFTNATTLTIEGALEPEAMPIEAIGTDEGVKQFTDKVEVLFDTAKQIAEAGIKAIFVDASVHPGLEEYFAKENIFVLSHIKKSYLNKIAQSSGSTLVTRKELFFSDTNKIKKYTGILNEIVEDSELGGFVLKSSSIYIPTVLISAETSSVTNEQERIAIDAAQALQMALRSGYVLGEGVAELNTIPAITKFLEENKDDSNVAAGIEVVKNSLPTLLSQIVENAGFDSEEVLNAWLKKVGLSSDTNSHDCTQNMIGINLDNGNFTNLEETEILDPLEVKINAFKIATEIASQVLKINLVLQAKNI